MAEPTEKPFPCLREQTHDYTGCVGWRCPHFDLWNLQEGCLFYPRVHTAERLRDSAQKKPLRDHD